MGFLMLLGVTNRYKITKFAYSGEEAIKEIQQAIDEDEPFKYGLILMDCNMPFLDGFEATKRIRSLFTNQGIERNRQPKIIAVTGHAEEQYDKKALISGMDNVYHKPLQIKELGELLVKMKIISKLPENLDA